MALSSDNIRINDVQEVLGTTSSNLKDLCTNTKINPWSKWKPINSSVTTMDESTLASANYGIGLKQITANDIKLLTSINSTTYNNWLKGYIYDIPSTNFRLGDFRNYEHNALPPIQSAFLDNMESSLQFPTKGGTAEIKIPVYYSVDNANSISKEIYSEYTVPGIAFANIYNATIYNQATKEFYTPDIFWFTSYYSYVYFKNADVIGKTIPIIEFMCKEHLAGQNVFTYGDLRYSDVLVTIPSPLHYIKCETNPLHVGSDIITINFEGFVDSSDIQIANLQYTINGTESANNDTIEIALKISQNENGTLILPIDTITLYQGTIGAGSKISNTLQISLPATENRNFYWVVLIKENGAEDFSIYEIKKFRQEPFIMTTL